MNGFITLAVGNGYLERAAAFALSARRFGCSTILLHADNDPGRFPSLFAKTIPIQNAGRINQSGRLSVWELKQLCYEHSEMFDCCAYADADSLVIRDPTGMFQILTDHPMHTPGGRPLADQEKWATPPALTVRQVATRAGVAVDAPIQTLNGGFLLWKRSDTAAKWFQDFSKMFSVVMDIYLGAGLEESQVRDELCMSLAFALQHILLPRSDSSIGVWDAMNLVLDIREQRFECNKGFYWEGHRFHPYIAHFGGSGVSLKYRECVNYLLKTVEQIDLPLFAAAELDSSDSTRHTRRSVERAYNLAHWPGMPKVSCQCITYGRPHLLNEAVESFLRQDYAGEKELVILNDHPTILVEPFKHPEIKVFNVGARFHSIGEKRNACCALCTGQVIFPWDDDDISLPWRISFTLEQMKNHHYMKPDRLWYWDKGAVSARKAVAHAMGAWSRALFDEVRGYPHIQSGQDQAIESLFGATGKRNVVALKTADLFYIYRFPGTGSYHLSAYGYGNGLADAEQYVARHVKPGRHQICPKWNTNYVSLVKAAGC
jgi:hypothetical protein